MLKLLFIGDWGRQGCAGQRRVAAGMASLAARWSCDAVVTTGDNFYDDGVLSVEDDHWALSFRNVYSTASLAVPWYACLGNHDYRGDPEAQLRYARRDRRWRLPGRHYARLLPIDAEHTLHLIVLDTTPFVEACWTGDTGCEPRPSVAARAAQLHWLDATLESSTARWKIVVGHHPVLSGSPYHGSTAELEDLLRPRLERYAVQAYVCGHEHDLQHLEAGGVHFLVSGAAAEWRPTGELPQTRFACPGLGFLSAELGRAELVFRFHDDSGAVIYETRQAHSAPRADRAA